MSDVPSAFGHCAACETVHSLGEGNSHTHALELIQQLEEFKRIDDLPPLSDGEHPPRPTGTPPEEGNLNSPLPRRGGRSETTDGVGSNLQSKLLNHKFSTDYLLGDARGQMFGVLECEDAEGNTVILKAFSCQYNGEWLVDGWVPPIFDVDAFHQLTHPVYKEISALGQQIQNDPQNKELIEQRASLSRNLMQEIHGLYTLTNFNGETSALHPIYGAKKVPAGTGDCCAPKLLNYAALHGLKPLGLSEFYWGKESKSGARQHGEFYPACKEKCQPILGFMLCRAEDWSSGIVEKWSDDKSNTPPLQHSIELVYQDDAVVVICKPSGLLSVPGKGPDNQDSVTARIKTMFPGCPDHPEVHRLDMDTSGLMVIARTKEAHRELSRQFHDRETGKRYIALLDGELTEACPADLSRRSSAKAEGLGESGSIELPFRLDIDNRPVQIYDPVHGKIGITHWKALSADNEKTRVEFTPITGRTHQLRVHSASEHGLGVPIVGDRLYGTGTAPGQLKLHATFLSFTHPRTGEKMEFHSKPNF